MDVKQIKHFQEKGDLFMNKEIALPNKDAGQKRSRTAYCFECMFEYLVAVLVADAFLAKVLMALGFSDSATGVISSFISLAFLFQFLSFFVARKIRNVKSFCTLFHCVGQLFFLSLYILPLLPFADGYRKPLAVICILLAYFGNYLVSTVIYRWGNSYVSPEKRGSYTALKEGISLVGGIITSLSVGFVIERFEEKGDLNGGFMFAAICIFIFCFCDFLCLILIKNGINGDTHKEAVSFSRVLSGTLGNKSFRSVLIQEVLWKFALYLTFGFLGTYKLSDLGFTVTQIQIMTVGGCLGRIVFSPLFARISDKCSYLKCFEAGAIVTLAGFLCSAFASPALRLLIIFQTVLYNIGQAGVAGAMVNIVYSYVDEEVFSEAVALKNSISGIFGFIAALIGGKIVAAVQASGNTFLGFTLRGQQLLSFMTCAIMLITLVYAHFVVEHRPSVERKQ